MRIEGVAHLQQPGEWCEDWALPDGPIPLRVEFDPRKSIGTAVLERSPGAINCTAQILHNDWFDGRRLGLVPKLAIGYSRQCFNPQRPAISVMAVSVVGENSNREVPAYEIVEDE